MFDVNSPIEIELRTATAGKVPVTVRWPADEEWVAHRKRRKVFMRQMGRGLSETEIDSGNADAFLYDLIKQNGAPPLTTGEAVKVIGAISLCDVLGVELGSDEAEVELQILTGEARHWLKIPTMDQVRELQRSTHLITMPYNRAEIRTNLDAAARLWDKCAVRSEGYAGPVPNIHKDFAIHAVINAIEQEVTAKYDERNF